MKASFILFVFFLFFLISCEKESTSPNFTLVEGTWVGTLGSDSLVLTFIEGEFEGSPTLSGSAFITTDTSASSYIIMSGSHDRQKNILFALYKYPVVGKSDFILKGILNYNKIDGTFTRYDQSGNIIHSGNWAVKTWY